MTNQYHSRISPCNCTTPPVASDLDAKREKGPDLIPIDYAEADRHNAHIDAAAETAENETELTVPQWVVWIRSRNLAMVLDEHSLTMAELAMSGGALDPSDCGRAIGYLTEALCRGRLQLTGKRAQLEFTEGEPAYRILSDERELVPQALWQNGGKFTDDLKQRRVVAGVPGETLCWVDVTVDADHCMAHWRAPASILEHGPRPLREALDLLEPEDCPPWVLAHPDVAVTGLNSAGVPVSVDRRVFLGPFGIDRANNTITTGDGGLTWRAVTVELATSPIPHAAPLVQESVEPPISPAAPICPETGFVIVGVSGERATVGHHPIMRAEPIAAPLPAILPPTDVSAADPPRVCPDAASGQAEQKPTPPKAAEPRRGAGNVAYDDAELIERMGLDLGSNKYKSPRAAARAVMNIIPGHGDPENRARRLANKFLQAKRADKARQAEHAK